MVWAEVIVTLKRFQDFSGGHPFTWRKKCYGLCKSLANGTRQDAGTSWFKEPNTLRQKKSRERLLLKHFNLLNQVKADNRCCSDGGAKNPERERNHWKRQRVAGSGGKQTNHARMPNSSYSETSYSPTMTGTCYIAV